MSAPEMLTGWVKLSRSIRGHWVWNNPRWLQWWLDLLLSAAWEDTVVRKRRRWVPVRRGEVPLGVRELQRRWGLDSDYSVRSFLLDIAAEGMINIVKLPTFTSRDEAAAHFSAQNVAQNVAQSPAQSVAHFWHGLIICNYESYQGFAEASLRTFERTSLRSNERTSLRKDLRTSADSHLFNNKEYKEYKDSVVVDARACEKEKAGEEACATQHPRQTEEIPFYEEAFWKWVWEGAGETLWGAARRELGADGKTLARWMAEVRLQWKSSGVRHTGHADAVNHLLSTLRKKAAAAAAPAAPGATSAQSRREQARRALRRAAGMEPEPDPAALSGRETEEIWVEAEEVS